MQPVFQLIQILNLEPKFLQTFFRYTVNEWNNLDNITKSSESYLNFRKKYVKFGKTQE